MQLGNTTTLRGTITVSHGASVGTGARNDVTATFTGARVGDGVVINPVAAPANFISVVTPTRVITANEVQVSVVNTSSATIAAGTQVQYLVHVIKASGNPVV